MVEVNLKQDKITLNNYSEFKNKFLQPKKITGSLCDFVVTSEEELNNYINNDNPRILAQNIGDRKTTIIENKNGSVDMFCNKPETSTLVLSGGGAKGCCLIGAHTALEEMDKWKHIKKISGTSAGAMMSCLMSTGMNSKELQTIIDGMKPHAMASSYETIEDELIPRWTNNNKENIMLSTKKRHLIDEDKVPKTIPEKIKFYFLLFISLFIGKERRACKLEKFLCYVTSCYFLNKINELDQEKQQEIQDLINKLKYQKDHPAVASKEDARITFADLDRLSKYIPGMKQLEVNTTIIVNGTAQTCVYNNENTPDMDIYTAVRISASLPGLFPKYKKNIFANTNHKNKKEQTKLKVVQTDGGCIVNTPTAGSQNRKELSNNHYIDDCKDSLAMVYGDDLIHSSNNWRPPAYNFGNAVMDFALDTDVTHQYHEQCEIMRYRYIDQTIMTKLIILNKNGETKTNHTTNMLISAEDIHAFQKSAYEDVKAHIEKTKTELLGNHYMTLKEALFALKDIHLNSFLNDLRQQQNENNLNIINSATEVINMRKEASVIMDEIKYAISVYDDAIDYSKEEKIIDLKEILFTLDNKYAEEEEFKTWFSIEMHNSKDKYLNRYLDLINENRESNDSAFLSALYKESKKRSHRYAVYNIITTQINPLIFKLGQTDENIALLENVKTSLLCSKNAEEVDYMIAQLNDLYKLTTIDKIQDEFHRLKNKFKSIKRQHSKPYATEFV